MSQISAKKWWTDRKIWIADKTRSLTSACRLTPCAENKLPLSCLVGCESLQTHEKCSDSTSRSVICSNIDKFPEALQSFIVLKRKVSMRVIQKRRTGNHPRTMTPKMSNPRDRETSLQREEVTGFYFTSNVYFYVWRKCQERRNVQRRHMAVFTPNSIERTPLWQVRLGWLF